MRISFKEHILFQFWMQRDKAAISFNQHFGSVKIIPIADIKFAVLFFKASIAYIGFLDFLKLFLALFKKIMVDGKEFFDNDTNKVKEEFYKGVLYVIKQIKRVEEKGGFRKTIKEALNFFAKISKEEDNQAEREES